MRRLRRFLKRYLPKSLFGRALLIVLVPILVLQGVMAALFLQRHYDAITSQMARTVAQELNYALERVEAAPTVEAARGALEQMSEQFGMQMGLDEGARIDGRAVRRFYDVTGGIIEETLRERLPRAIALDLVGVRKHADLRIATSKGVLRVLIPRNRLNPSNPHQLLIWTTLTALALALVAAWFLRNQIQPIRELAQAAAAFGRGQSVPFRPSGAREVRAAGAAFLDMRNRIERQIEQRTRMLSGVSHDLRTPLTRMKLALAVAPESPELAEIERDVGEMERMLAGFLDFARGEAGEASETVDVPAFAEEIVEDARRKGIDITLFTRFDGSGPPVAELRRGPLRRCLMNLVDNAALWGGRAALTVRMTGRRIEFSVEDDGPGIPPEKREEVLKPFTRLDEARNQDQGAGVGLGLSIAQDVARSHGGTLVLDESPALGGLRATVILPRGGVVRT